MKVVRVNLGARSYDIVIGDDILGKSRTLFHQHKVGSRLFLISNPTVFELYGRDWLRQFETDQFDITYFLIPDGEKHKTLQTVENIYTYLLAQQADRNSVLVALGGGVTGDIVGFVAATFLRGIPYVQIPTTLLAQVDSSVGGKTGVNHRLGKNMIGAFYQPDLVCIDTTSLSTLTARDFRSGLYEVIKYGLIYDREFFDYFCDNLESVKKRDPAVLEVVVSRCCEIKAEITSLDERESDLRRILNYGHTLGHALEATLDYEGVTHGEAVAYGMLAATHISHQAGYLDESTTKQIVDAIRSIGTLPPVDRVSFPRMMEAVRHDKKRQQDATVFVLLKEIGKTIITSDLSGSIIEASWNEAVG